MRDGLAVCYCVNAFHSSSLLPHEYLAVRYFCVVLYLYILMSRLSVTCNLSMCVLSCLLLNENTYNLKDVLDGNPRRLYFAVYSAR
jgi:hypothetical protein